MTTMTLNQIIAEISHLQRLLDAVKLQAMPFFNPIQAARVIQQLLGVQREISYSDANASAAVAEEIEFMLEQAYEILGTVEITA